MAISTTGRVVRAKRKNELRRVEALQNSIASPLDYNHLRVQLSDGSDRHLLFTDAQIVRAAERAAASAANGNPLPKLTWVRELWYEGFIEMKSADVRATIKAKGLPPLARRYNHIRVDAEGVEVHLLFTDSDVRSALDRVREAGDKLPKISWISDGLIETLKGTPTDASALPSDET